MHARLTTFNGGKLLFDEICHHSEQLNRSMGCMTLPGSKMDKIKIDIELETIEDFEVLEYWIKMAKKALRLE